MPTQILISQTTITFPEIALRPRDGHKLRGYFGNLFREYSPLLHNHLTNEQPDAPSAYLDSPTPRYRYAYPLVQYKVIDQVPTLIGLGEGAQLLTQLFLQMRHLDINGERFPILSKHIHHNQAVLGMADELIEYQFDTLWMALNQSNYRDYRRYTYAEQQAQLKRILITQLLATFREFNLWLEPQERILVRLSVNEQPTQFKNQRMVGFTGHFLINVSLPDKIGLGKAVSRGFGSISWRG